MAYEKNPDELGCLWSRDGAKGEYLTGEINGVRVVCFLTKPSEKGPKWRVLKAKPREDQTDRPARVERSSGVDRIDDDQIEF